jgi:hypothetical protein
LLAALAILLGGPPTVSALAQRSDEIAKAQLDREIRAEAKRAEDGRVKTRRADSVMRVLPVARLRRVKNAD